MKYRQRKKERKANEFWQRVAPGLARHMGLGVPTMDEAQKAFDEAEDEPLSDEQIAQMVRFAKTGKRE